MKARDNVHSGTPYRHPSSLAQGALEHHRPSNLSELAKMEPRYSPSHSHQRPPSHPPHPTHYSAYEHNHQPYPGTQQSPRPNLPSPLLHHVAQPSPYQPMTSSPTFQTHRPFSSHQSIMSAPYEPSPSTHAHPVNQQASLHQSPTRHYTSLSNGSSRDPPAQSDTRPQSQGVSEHH